MMLNLSRFLIQYHQSGRGTVFQGILGDEFLG